MSNIALYTVLQKAANTTFDTFNIPFDILFIVQYLAPSTPLTSKSHSIYTVDPNTKSSNDMNIWLKALNYFELQLSLN